MNQAQRWKTFLEWWSHYLKYDSNGQTISIKDIEMVIMKIKEGKIEE